MGTFSNLANELVATGTEAAAVAAKAGAAAADPFATGKMRVLDRLSRSRELARGNQPMTEKNKKRVCYTCNDGIASVGIKYGARYLADDDGNKFLQVADDPNAVIAAIDKLTDCVKLGHMDAVIDGAVKVEQERSAARSAKRLQKKAQQATAVANATTHTGANGGVRMV